MCKEKEDVVVMDVSLLGEYISRYFKIKSYPESDNPIYVIQDYDEAKFNQLVQDLNAEGYIPHVNRYKNYFSIEISKNPKVTRENNYLNLILFLATICTTFLAGYLFGQRIWDGITFSIAIMSIIGAHETAHYLAAKKHKVKATLPYFIPAPTIIGTFGAVINVKSPLPTRNALFDLGVSGPLAGIVVTIPVLIIGLYYSSLVPLQQNSIVFIPPLLMSLLASLIIPKIPEGLMIQLHPVAFAGWVGLVITMLNLMPVSFLDGGHISRTLFNQRIHRIISIFGIIITLLLGWIPMGILMMILTIWNRKHPGAMDNIHPLSRNRKLLAVLVLIIFILCLAPIPLPL